jgi:predicted AAA+ superfamily ATPase
MARMEIKRHMESAIKAAFNHYPVVTVTGPRQSGKTTLVKMLFPDKPHCSLEDPDVRRFAESDPRSFLAGFPDGAVFDEVQRVPSRTTQASPQRL